MSDIPCFWLEPTDVDRLRLRRYRSGKDVCPAHGYHDASTPFGTAPARKSPEGYYQSHEDLAPPHDDPRWPSACDCGYVFQPEDNWQVFADHIYRRIDTGEEMTIRDAPAGALWDATWWTPNPPRPDGICLMCKTPGGEWMVDGEANNCTRKGEPHSCWPRHGDPRDPLGLKTGKPLHVDKNGDTCAAGAGSILCRSYHGFLQNGHLTGA